MAPARHQPSDPPPARLLPHAVPHRARLLLERRAARARLPAEDQRVLRRRRRGGDGRRLRPERHAAPAVRHHRRPARRLVRRHRPAWARWRPARRTRRFRADAYASVATLMQLAGSTYYQTSWTALTLQMMTGLMPVPDAVCRRCPGRLRSTRAPLRLYTRTRDAALLIVCCCSPPRASAAWRRPRRTPSRRRAPPASGARR